MIIIRCAQASVDDPPAVPDADPLQAQAAQAFADDLAANRVPSVQTLRRDAATSEGALPDDILDAHSAYSA